MKADKEHVRSIVSMQDVMGLYGLQPHRGNVYFCPFHEEKTPSATIKNNFFYCFGCQNHADIFKFVQLMNNCTFPEALDFLCDRFGIPNDSQSTEEQRREYARMMQKRKQDTAERKAAQEYQDYAWRRLCDYMHWLWKQPATELVANHITWCEGQLDRMWAGKVQFDGSDVFRDIDSRLKAMWRQIGQA